MPEILTSEEAAEMMRMSVPTLRGLAASGAIPAIQMGEWRFLKAQLLEYMAGRAKDEQRRRQEQQAEKKLNPTIIADLGKRGRPSKKVDLSLYQ
jgi:excisionase family DNA binding protein